MQFPHQHNPWANQAQLSRHNLLDTINWTNKLDPPPSLQVLKLLRNFRASSDPIDVSGTICYSKVTDYGNVCNLQLQFI